MCVQQRQYICITAQKAIQWSLFHSCRIYVYNICMYIYILYIIIIIYIIER